MANGGYQKDEFKTESEYEGNRKSSYAKFIQKLPTVDEIGESTASLWTNFNAKWPRSSYTGSHYIWPYPDVPPKILPTEAQTKNSRKWTAYKTNKDDSICIFLDDELRSVIYSPMRQTWPHRLCVRAQAGFQIDALSSATNWLIFQKRRFDWPRVPPRKRQFENPSQVNKTKRELS